MITPANIDWQKQALELLVGLYPVKQEKDFNSIYRKAVILAQQCAHAADAAIVRLEDKITARVLHASSGFIGSFVDADNIAAAVDKGVITIEKGSFIGIDADERIVLLPVSDRAFSGCFILLLHKEFDVTDGFKEFLRHAWVGLKETTMLIQTFFSIEQLSTRFNAILGTIPEGIVFVDDIGSHGWVNATASEILKLPAEKNTSIAIAGAMQMLRNAAVNQEALVKEGQKLFSSPNQTIKNWEWIFGDPVTQVLHVTCVPAVSTNIKGRLWVFDDVTPMYKASHELKAANAELAEKRRIADEQNLAKSDFLANMSHEIRTPMNGVIGMTSLLAHTELNEEQADYVDSIRISGESLLSIINDILDFSKIESGKMDIESEPVVINTVIEETYDLLSVKANEKGLDLLYYIDPRVPSEILADEVRLKQVLVNLVNNGLKFTEKGEILITVNTLSHDGDLYNIEFVVKDSGIGIPKDKFYRLFESFSQVDSSTTRKYGGTGLGLAICQRLVSLMGGTIRAESEEGVGSSFIFNIVVPVSKRAIKYNKEKGIQAELNGKSVLILDDNNTNLKILSTQAEMWGMLPIVTNRFEDAITLVKERNFDLAVIDLLMPGKDGIEVTRMMKQIKSELQVILFSSAGYFPQEDKSAKNLFAAILNKPVKQSQIEKTFIDVLSKRIAVRSANEGQQAGVQTGVSPINILVAEDNEVNQKLILRALDKLGYKADLAENGKEALVCLKAKQYQLVFMDVMMPEMDGYEATGIINETYFGKERPIIIAMTAKALSGDKENIIAFGMDDYIGKPFKLNDVQEKIEMWKPKLMEKI